MLFRQIRICVPPKISAEFVRRAKEAFPKETLGYFIGRTDENMTIKVEEIYYPLDVDAMAQTDKVDVPHRWFREARRRAKQLKASVLGDIHSHPYTSTELLVWKRQPDCSPSESDWDRARLGLVQAVCLIQEGSTGKLRAKTRYWGPLVPLAEVVEKKV